MAEQHEYHYETSVMYLVEKIPLCDGEHDHWSWGFPGYVESDWECCDSEEEAVRNAESSIDDYLEEIGR